jgi:NTE family protein
MSGLADELMRAGTALTAAPPSSSIMRPFGFSMSKFGETRSAGQRFRKATYNRALARVTSTSVLVVAFIARRSSNGVVGSVRIGVVLSAGGLRGAAHAGVLRQLVRHQVPLHTIVGVSAGAVVAAYYAAVGLDLDEMIDDAAAFRGRHLLVHSVAVRGGARLAPGLRRWCGVIPDRLRQLEAARFDRLHHGVHRLGIVCHDLSRGAPRYFGTGCDQRVTLSDAVRASASIPHLFPAIPVSAGTEPLRLTDGGVSDPVPVTFARALMGATHIVVSDCCSIGARATIDSRTAWIRPRIRRTGALWSPREGLLATVRDGEAAVTDAVLDVIRRWLDVGSLTSTLSAAV